MLLRGVSGAGKSDLALRLIDQGARLVADDQTQLTLTDGLVLARAPQTIEGQMEVRGLGIAELAPLSDVPVGLVVDLVDGRSVERLPEGETCTILDVRLPLMRLDPFEASAPAKLRLALAVRAAPPDGAVDAVDAGDTPQVPAAPRESTPARQRELILVTGMSGAGRSTALSILEDLGYESIDNLPLELLRPLIAGGSRSLALGVDIRTRGFAVAPLLEQLDRGLSGAGLGVTLLFLDCEDAVLGRRYTETRRRHPLSRGRPLADGIAAERNLLAPLRARADPVVDTSALSPAELRQVLAGHFERQGAEGMAICVTSFAYRNGLPREADLVFDVRFLRNPHYEPELRPLTGRDEAVDRFIAADPRMAPFFARLTDLLATVLPDYRGEGKTYLTIALGCTGGRHRSVAVAERLAQWLAARGEPATLLHRDLGELPASRPEGP
ncbi:MAG: RNase adapter RapZ [Kiloniellales bacterium]|nr:RNase adapter RapZ [Kiloniellales bacterium]